MMVNNVSVVRPSRPLSRIGRKWMAIRRNGGLYALLLPSLILLVLFAYWPMYGVLIAFKDFSSTAGIMGSPWADPFYKYFLKFFNSYQFGPTIRNTLVVSFYSLIAGFPIPILLALGLNQMRAKYFKRFFQTVSYLPHFISTVVMVSLIILWLAPDSGLLANLCALFGYKAPNLMGSPAAFSSIYVWSDVWQHMGWNSIVYLAALAGVDPSLYEAATVDGASRWQKIRHIDLAMLLPTAVVLLVLSAGQIMNVGFEKVYLMQNNLNLASSEVISTYVYRIGIINRQPSYSTAINLFNNVINLILLLTVNQASKRLTENSLW